MRVRTRLVLTSALFALTPAGANELRTEAASVAARMVEPPEPVFALEPTEDALGSGLAAETYRNAARS